MIGRLRGALVELDGDVALVEAGGVGYELRLPPGEGPRLGNPGDEVVVYVHTHVREDALELYGFAHPTGRDLFRVLLRLNKVGPRIALDIVGTLTPGELARAVVERDYRALQRIRGVGKKTAERIVIELSGRDEVTRWLAHPSHTQPAHRDAQAPPGSATAAARGTFAAALRELGFGEREVREAARHFAEELDGEPVENVLRQAIRWLYEGRRKGSLSA